MNPPPIRVALFEESAGNVSGWVAQALDLPLIAQGKTIEEAQESFEAVMCTHVILSFERGRDPFYGLPLVQPEPDTQPGVDADMFKRRIQYSILEPATA